MNPKPIRKREDGVQVRSDQVSRKSLEVLRWHAKSGAMHRSVARRA